MGTHFMASPITALSDSSEVNNKHISYIDEMTVSFMMMVLIATPAWLA